MKLKILIASFILLLSLSILAFQPNKSSPARSIFTVSVNPLACKESEVYYNMTSHAFLVCTSLNTLSTVSFGSGGGSGGISTINGLSGLSQTLVVGSAGTNFSISSSGSTHTFNIPSASASNRGLLTSADWSTFNSKGDVLLASIQTITGAKTFNAGKLIIGTNSGAPTIVANSFYRDTSDGKLYVGKSDGSSWDEILEAGVSGPISTTLGGNGLVGFGNSVSSASTISISGKIFHVTGTTNITSISTSGIQSGSEITIIFDDVLTFTDGNNLKLAGNFITSADDTITLIFDGTNFYEVARSIN